MGTRLGNNAGVPPDQICSVDGCARETVYRTKGRPAWCVEHINRIFARVGMRPNRMPERQKDRLLATCLACGVESSVAFETVLDKAPRDERCCDACKLGHSWPYTAVSGLVFAAPRDGDPVAERARGRAEAANVELLQVGTRPGNQVVGVQVRCRVCERVSVWDVDATWGWKCGCTANPKVAVKASGTPPLLSTSDHEAAQWWDHEANPELLWRTVKFRARKTAWWVCPQGHRFEARVDDMTRMERAYCNDCRRLRDAEWTHRRKEWETTPVAAEPVLLVGWRDPADPYSTMVADAKGCAYVCPNGHNPGVSPGDFLLHGCKFCRANKTRKKAANTLAKTLPEIASTWHPTLNRKWTPETIQATSKRMMWWRDPRCGHEWEERVVDRDKYARLRCPGCKEILDSLAWEFPEIAAQWSPSNPLSAWMVRPTSALPFTPEWLCSVEPTHRWEATTANRVNGGQCPECRTHGKSRVELEHYEEAARRFTSVASGTLLRAPAFTRRTSWTADILVHDALPGRDLVIEYDGAYWHADKVDLDLDKSRDLLAAGRLVARLREAPLPMLGIEDQNYLAVVVEASAPNPPAAIDLVEKWLANHAARSSQD
jgi:hypothetical protein